MKSSVIQLIEKNTKLKASLIANLIEIPPDSRMGDYAFPCFILAKELKKSPVEIAKSLAQKIKPSKEIEKIQAIGPYLNFFVNSNFLISNTIKKIRKEKDKYGSSSIGKGKKIIVEMSSPNIAKPFGIGNLRSTIIGNSVANISSFLGFKIVKINYLGDWGTPFGKIIAGYEKWGSEKKLKANPIKHLYEIYVKATASPEFEELGREYFKKLESGNKKYMSLWKKFREYSIKDFKKIYDLLGVKFNVYSGESFYNKNINSVVKELEKKKLLERSDNALIVNLEKYNLGASLIEKTDGTKLYLTRDIAAAKDRYGKYKFHQMFYEVGSEQTLHFKQLFKILELMGYSWAKNAVHINHGLYLDKDGKKFAAREGKTVFMEDILKETIDLAKKEIEKRETLNSSERENRALIIARAAIIYGDLKNHRTSDAVFDIKRFVSFEGNTGPYLLYSYARARSILRKAGYNPKKKYTIKEISEKEKSLVSLLSSFPEVVLNAYNSLAPNIIANYTFELAQKFNEFYHAEKVIGSEKEDFLLSIVDAFSQVLKNSLYLLGISTLEQM